MSFWDDNRLVILGLMSTNEIIETVLNVPFWNARESSIFSIRYCGENQVNDIKATWSNLTKQPDVKEATVIKIQWNHLIFDFL